MSSRRQSIIMIGIGLIIIGCVILGFALSQPKIAVSDLTGVNTDAVQTTQTESIYSDFESGVSVQETNSSSSQAQSSEAVSDESVSVSYPLNLNTCTAEELMTISGIGEVKAGDIIAYREYLGGYTSVEQIKDIKGIGDKTYEKISPYLTV